MNLWFPRRIAIDCWDASSPWQKPRLARARQHLVDAVAAQGSSRAKSGTGRPSGGEAEEYRLAAQRMLFADSLEIASAVFATLFVLALTRMQDGRARTGPRELESVTV